MNDWRVTLAVLGLLALGVVVSVLVGRMAAARDRQVPVDARPPADLLVARSLGRPVFGLGERVTHPDLGPGTVTDPNAEDGGVIVRFDADPSGDRRWCHPVDLAAAPSTIRSLRARR